MQFYNKNVVCKLSLVTPTGMVSAKTIYGYNYHKANVFNIGYTHLHTLLKSKYLYAT